MGIEAAIGAALVTAGASAAAAAALAAVATAVIKAVVLGALSSALSPKPKKTPNLSGSFSAKAAGITQNVKQPVTVRRSLYGEARVGGSLNFIETTGGDQFIHMVLVLADHECEEIGEVWYNDVSIPPDYLDGSGNVIDGDFSGKARIKKHLGGSGEVADSALVSETSATSNFVGAGVCYVYVRLEYDRDIFPSSVPNITAWVKGKKLYDPRDSGTRWSPNGALFAYDYLTSPLDSLTAGVGVDSDNIDETYLNASANVAEEFVTTTAINDSVVSVDATSDIITLTGTNGKLNFQTGDRVKVTTSNTLPAGLSTLTNYFVIPYQRKTTPRIKLASSLANALAGTAIDLTDSGTGTHSVNKNAEPRYFGGGVIETNETTGDNLEDILTTIGGSAIYAGGSWKIKAASYYTPVFTFDESHILSNIAVRTKASRKDRFNLIKGVYVSPLNDGEPADYPPITNSTYVSNDGGRTIPIDYDLPMTQRPHTAQRLAKIKLERHRQELFFEADFSLHAMQVQAGDVVLINNTRFGWSSKPFEVVTWSLESRDQDGVPLFYVHMALQETASAVYDWNNGEETAVDPAPDTNLPNPLEVDPPTGLAVTPMEIRTAAGDLTYEFAVSWTPPTDIFVINGGKYEVEFKKSSESTWRTSFEAKDTDTSITVKQVEPSVNYDARMRSVNQIGVRSQYNSLLGFTVSSPSGATIRIDYGAIAGAVVESLDYGAITGGEDTTRDFGDII